MLADVCGHASRLPLRFLESEAGSCAFPAQAAHCHYIPLGRGGAKRMQSEMWYAASPGNAPVRSLPFSLTRPLVVYIIS
jgi:hypothetical protein